MCTYNVDALTVREDERKKEKDCRVALSQNQWLC